jgi:integrase
VKTALEEKKRETAGLYQRKLVWWLRYSFAGEQIRVNLHTRDLATAIEEAKRYRDKAPAGKGVEGWEKAISRYLEEKQQHTPPQAFIGKRWVRMNERTARNTASVLRVFARWTSTKDPAQITMKHLEDYLSLRIGGGVNEADERQGAKLKGSRAGARSILSTITAFLRHIGKMPAGRLTLPANSTLEKRTLVATPSEISTYIDAATNDNDRLALILGYRCGLREREIQHATAAWFPTNRAILQVPHLDQETGFTTKDLAARSIPIFTDDLPFLRRICLERPTGPLLRKTKRKGRKPSASGLYDFSAPVRRLVLDCGASKFTLHSMRHSFATNLLQAGVSIEVVASYLGDELDTVRKTYDHSKARKGATDAAHRGQREGDETRQQLATMAEKMQEILSAVGGAGASKMTRAEAAKAAKRFGAQIAEVLEKMKQGGS